MKFLFVNKHTARAVHRLDSVVFIINYSCVHIFFVVIPVSASFPKLSVKDNRCLNLYVAGFLMNFSPEINKCVFNNHALWKEEWESRTLFKKAEKLKFLAKFSVVTFFSLFNHIKVCFKV